MKKICLIMMAASMALLSEAQSLSVTEEVTFDEQEDSTQVTTIADIVNVQNMVSSRNSNVRHYEKVWSYTSYLDLTYNNPAELTPKSAINTGVSFNNGHVPDFKSDWGGALQIGHSYGLHRPIAGMVKFNLDYTFFDLNLNHFKAEQATDNTKIYDSDVKNGTYEYIPWNMEKVEANFGMALGPSITVAPFIPLNIPQLHFFKINAFYHIGYHVSALVPIYNSKYDEHPDMNNINDNAWEPSNWKLNFGHGLTQSFGFKISWKTIGFSWEVRNRDVDYKSVQESDYGKEHYKFKGTTHKLSLEFRY